MPSKSCLGWSMPQGIAPGAAGVNENLLPNCAAGFRVADMGESSKFRVLSLVAATERDRRELTGLFLAGCSATCVDCRDVVEGMGPHYCGVEGGARALRARVDLLRERQLAAQARRKDGAR